MNKPVEARRQCGVSLIEVLVALFVLAFGMRLTHALNGPTELVDERLVRPARESTVVEVRGDGCEEVVVHV